MEDKQQWQCIQKKVVILKDLGYLKQNEFLIQNGFRNLCDNIKYLKQNNGCPYRALQQLMEIKNKEDEELMQKIRQLNYEQQVKELQNLGYKNLEKMFELLKKYNGCVRMVKEDRLNSQKCVEEKILKKVHELGYTQAMDYIISKGYNIVRKNFYFLEKTSGDAEKSYQMILDCHDNYWKFTEEDCEKKRFIEMINERVKQLEQEEQQKFAASQQENDLKSLELSKQPSIESTAEQSTPSTQKSKGQSQQTKHSLTKSINFSELNRKSSLNQSQTKPSSKPQPKENLKNTFILAQNHPQNHTQIHTQNHANSKQSSHIIHGSVKNNHSPSRKGKAQILEQKNPIEIRGEQKQIHQQSRSAQHNQPFQRSFYTQDKSRAAESRQDDKNNWSIHTNWCYKKDGNEEKLNQHATEIINQDCKTQFAFQKFTQFIGGPPKPLKFMKLWNKYNQDINEVIRHVQSKQEKMQRINKICSQLPASQQAICSRKFKIIYFDCNNMFFVEETIRNLATSHKRCKAEKILIQLILNYCKFMGVQKVYLIFDQIFGSKNLQVFHPDKNFEFQIESAQPQFQTADEKLISLLKQFQTCSQISKDNVIIVTSDVELTSRFCDLGFNNFIKSKDFIRLVKSTLNDQLLQQILDGNQLIQF